MEEGAAILNNLVDDNGLVSIALTGTTIATVDGNTVSRTRKASAFSGLKQIEVGDGIALFSGARGIILHNQAPDNFRAGILADGADAASQIADNSASGNACGVVLQNLTEGVTVGDNKAESNTQADVFQPTGADALGIPDRVGAGLSIPQGP